MTSGGESIVVLGKEPPEASELSVPVLRELFCNAIQASASGVNPRGLWLLSIFGPHKTSGQEGPFEKSNCWMGEAAAGAPGDTGTSLAGKPGPS